MPTPNYLQMLRLKNIFGNASPVGNDLPQQGGIMGNQPFQMPQRPQSPISFGPTDVPIPPPDDDYDMMSNYTPEHAASDRFNQMVMNYPQFQEPSKKRRFGAAVLGSLTDLGTNFGGNKTGVKGTSVFDETTGKNQYMENIGHWKEQIAPLQQAANLERYSNANERQLAYQAGQSKAANRRLDITEQNNQARQDVASKRAATYDFKAKNPNHRYMQGKDGNLLAIDPITNETINLGKTGMSQAEIAELNQKNKLEQIDRQGDVRMGVAETRGWKPFEETGPDGTKRVFMYNEVTGEKRYDTNGATPYNKPGTNKPETEQAKKVGLFLKAQEVANKYPELAKWIELRPNNEFDIIEPPKPGFFSNSAQSDKDMNAARKARELIYGKEGQQFTPPAQAPIPQQPNTGGGGRMGGPGMRGGGAPTSQKPPTAPQGWKYVPKPGGGWTAVRG